MHPVAAFFLGAFYSIILGSAMTAGVKYLHPGTPATDNLLESVAWSIGSGIAVALATRLARSHPFAVGIASSFISASVWIALLLALRDNLDASSGNSLLGYPLSLKMYLISFALLILFVGLICSILGVSSRDEDELSARILLVPSGHWFWLWIASFAWVSVFPIVVYYFWLQIATTLYAIFHPSLWLRVGTGVFFGLLGIAALFKGIEVSLRAVSVKNSYGAVVWKRVLMFLIGTLLLASLVAPFLLNLDINRLKDMPASLGAHPWWLM